MQTSKILVTGASGLVGSAVLETAPGWSHITALNSSTDLRDPAACYKVFESSQPDYVIHLAARVGGVQANSRYLADFYRDNILINTNVLHACYQRSVKKVISLLSTCIYPDKIDYPIRAHALHNGEPHSSNYGYAYAKRMIEVQSRAYNQQYGTNFVCLVPNNIYGPNDNFHPEDSHVIPSIINKVYKSKQNGSPIHLWGDGSSLREFTYSHDIAKAIWWALLDYNGHLLNIGTNEEISIAKAAEIICSKFGVSYDRVIWDTTKPCGQLRKPSDKSDFYRLCDMKHISFDNGIGLTIEWFK